MGTSNTLINVALVSPMWGVSIGHLVVVVALLIDGVGTTSVIGLRDDHDGDWIPLALGAFGLAATYLVATVMAVYGLLNPGKGDGFHLVCWAPQQALMFAGAISVIEAIIKSHYLDGTGTHESGISITRPHLIVDQWWYLAFAVQHFVYFWLWRKVLRQTKVSQAETHRIIAEAQDNGS